MKRRDFVRGLVGMTTVSGILTSQGCVQTGGPGSRASSMIADGFSQRQYQDAIVIDALASPIQFNIPQRDFPLTSSDLESVKASGITALNLTVNRRATSELSSFEATLARMAQWEREIDTHPDVFSRVRSVADIRAAKQNATLGLIHGFQDTVPFGEDLQRIDTFHGLGVRIAQLTYNIGNKVGSGSLVPTDSGLTEFGRQVVERMDDLGMLVDLSHCGPQTTIDGIRASRMPVAITHSGSNTIFKHPRNKDDSVLREMADRGGVLGIYLMPFLNPAGPPDIDDMITHLEYAVNLCGEDHVGIGSDQGIVPLDIAGDFPANFERVSASRQAAGIAAPREDIPPYLPELNNPQRMQIIAERLADRGYSIRLIEKILGDNFLRLFEEVWEA
ncbi:MAG: membrane dipeptidase [Gammaproteobacteria bacterium]|nr:membrane dipeptidase [Gammaproteobacteria bacterium]